jgi:uracil-DNA glycosylase family 4
VDRTSRAQTRRNAKCSLCRLHDGCHTVCLSGEGKPKRPYVAFIGEAPGALEDAQGRPFIGPSGDRLRSLIRRLGLEKDCYITNVVKCRPPENRKPREDELAACRGYLTAELKRIKPRNIVLLGATAIEVATETKRAKIGMYRGIKNWTWMGARVIATYHPAATLRPGGQKYLQLLIEDLNRLATEEWVPREKVTWKQVELQDTQAWESALCDVPPDAPIALDLETTGLNPFTPEGRILCAAWSWEKDKAFVTTDIEALVAELRVQRFNLVGQNIKFDLLWLRQKFGYVHKGELDDTYVMAHLLDETAPSKSLKTLAGIHTGYGPYAQGVMDARDGGHMAEVPEEKLLEYCAYDAAATWRVAAALEPQFRRNDTRLLYAAEMQVLPVVVDMESSGLAFDRGVTEKLASDYKGRIEAIATEFTRITGVAKPGSTQQLAVWLHEHCRVPVLAHTTTGKPKLDKWVLPKLLLLVQSPLHRFGEDRAVIIRGIELLLQYRGLTKILSTYLTPYLEIEGGRVHACFNQCGTETGRFSCEKPNLQNLPRETKHPVKTMFVVPPGRTLVGADYSQIELRIGAIETRDKRLLDAFKAGMDLHSMTAEAIVGHAPSPEERSHAKTVNFGIFFGMGPKKLAEDTGKPHAWAQEYIRNWYALYPGVREWQQEQEQRLQRDGHLVNMFGRIRHLGLALKTAKRDEYLAVLREACNFPVQGGAADLMKLAMVRVADKLPKDCHIVVQVHDQILVECPENQWEKIALLMYETMSNANVLMRYFGYKPRFNIPTPVDVKVGPVWGTMEDVTFT